MVSVTHISASNGQQLDGLSTQESSDDVRQSGIASRRVSARAVRRLEGISAEESSTDAFDDVSALAAPTLDTSGARHRIALQQKRLTSHGSKDTRMRSATIGTTRERRALSAHTTETASFRDDGAAVTPDATPTAAQRAARLATASLQSRHGGGSDRFAGHSLAFLINQQAAAAATSLRPTGVRTGGAVPAFSTPHAARPVVLYRCKGRRQVITQRVPLTGAQLSTGDSYVLDAVDTLIIALGAQSNRMEQAHARALAIAINDNEGGRRANTTTTQLTIGGTDSDPVMADMLSRIAAAAAAGAGAYPTIQADADGALVPTVVAATEVEDNDDAEVVQRFFAETVLCEVVAGSGPKVAAQGRNLRREHLNTTGAFVLLSMGELYVWVGRKAPPEAAEAARAYAEQLVIGAAVPLEGVPPPTWPLEELKQGVETSGFTSKFARWEVGADLSVAAQRSAPPLVSQAFRARAKTASGVLPARPAAFENVKPTPKPHERELRPTFSVAMLRDAVAERSLPPDVDGSWLEHHLSDADFESEFGMARVDFDGTFRAAMPNSKQRDRFRKAGAPI